MEVIPEIINDCSYMNDKTLESPPPIPTYPFIKIRGLVNHSCKVPLDDFVKGGMNLSNREIISKTDEEGLGLMSINHMMRCIQAFFQKEFD